jgi:hypothetical protein
MEARKVAFKLQCVAYCSRCVPLRTLSPLENACAYARKGCARLSFRPEFDAVRVACTAWQRDVDRHERS